MNKNLSLVEFLFQTEWDNIERIIIVGWVGWNQDRKSAFDCESRSDYEDVLGEPLVLGISYFVEYLPGNQHGHDCGFSCSSCHFRTYTFEFIVSLIYFDAYFLRVGGLGEPNEGFNCIHLTEKERICALFAVIPMI